MILLPGLHRGLDKGMCPIVIIDPPHDCRSVLGRCSTNFIMRTEKLSNRSSRSDVCFFIFPIHHSMLNVRCSMFIYFQPVRLCLKKDQWCKLFFYPQILLTKLVFIFSGALLTFLFTSILVIYKMYENSMATLTGQKFSRILKFGICAGVIFATFCTGLWIKKKHYLRKTC